LSIPNLTTGSEVNLEERCTEQEIKNSEATNKVAKHLKLNADLKFKKVS
jgi:hypothetical protein